MGGVINMILGEITGTDWAFIATFFVTACAGIMAQYASHHFTKKREEEKSLKECYQNLYSPILYEVTKYIDIETVYKGDMLKDKFKKETVFEGIKKHIQLNLKYAPIELIRAYDAVRRSEIYEDFKGDEEALTKADLCFTFLEELNFLNVKLDMNYSYEEILKYRIYYSLWIFVYEYSDFNLANNVLKHKWTFNQEEFTEELVVEIVQLIKKDKSERVSTMKYFINNLLVRIIAEKNKDAFQPTEDLHQLLLEFIKMELNSDLVQSWNQELKL